MNINDIADLFGNGTLQESPLFSPVFDWLFRTISAGKRQENEEGSIEALPFDILQYETLHAFLSGENEVMPQDNSPFGLDETSLMDEFADQVAMSISNYTKSFTNREKAHSISQIRTVLMTGLITEFFKLEIKSDLFETQYRSRCLSDDEKDCYKRIYGAKAASSASPEARNKRRWLGEDFGL